VPDAAEIAKVREKSATCFRSPSHRFPYGVSRPETAIFGGALDATP
jgi:hypothetical protein